MCKVSSGTSLEHLIQYDVFKWHKDGLIKWLYGLFMRESAKIMVMDNILHLDRYNRYYKYYTTKVFFWVATTI